jgi:hypothetical protein
MKHEAGPKQNNKDLLLRHSANESKRRRKGIVSGCARVSKHSTNSTKQTLKTLTSVKCLADPSHSFEYYTPPSLKDALDCHAGSFLATCSRSCVLHVLQMARPFQS